MDKQLNLNIPPDIKPLFADEVNVNAGLKVNIEKDDNGKEIINKSGFLNVVFFDNATRAVISRIVIDPITAKNLSVMLKANAEKLSEELKSDKIPKQMKEQIKSSKQPVSSIVDGSYIG